MFNENLEKSRVVYEVDPNNCLKKYAGETGRKLKERMDKHKDGGEKSQKDKKKTGLSQHMNNTLHNHSLAQDNVRIIYRKNNWKKRNLKETARKTSHNKNQLMSKKNFRNIILNNKT